MNIKLHTLIPIAAVMLGGWLICSPSAVARDTTNDVPGRAARGQLRNRLEKVAQELDLTAEQRQQLKPILQEEGQKLKALRADTSLSKAQKHQQLKAIRQDLLTRVKPILTPEQLARWQEIRQQMHPNRKQDS
jgi:Spy/CpxP family protein refolding chaperone